jgi:lysophospholipase L1-like esterase
VLRARSRRILIVGDSLSFNREHTGQGLEECWPWLLKTSMPGADVWVRSEPASLIDAALAQVRLFESSLALFDGVIVQSGISDSCPRPIPHWLHLILGRLGNGKLQRLVNRNYRLLLRFASNSWTSEEKFRKTLLDIVTRVTPTSTVLFVPIVRPCKKLTAKVPGSARAADRYNAIIHDVCEEHGAGRALVLSDFEDACSEDHVLDDGHHLNALGHRLLADQIVEVLADASQLDIAA